MLRVNENSTPQKIAHLSLINPSQQVYDSIPHIEHHCHVTIQKYFSECYHNLALIIKGSESEVIKAFNELKKLEKSGC